LRLFAKAFRGKLFAFLVRDFFEGDEQTALDAWNETLYRVRTRVGSFEPSRSAFRTWAWNQARYAALSLRRNWRRWREMQGLTDVTDPLADVGDPITAAEQAALYRAFSRLRPRERLLLFYRFVLEWKPRELAAELFTEMSAGQIRVAVHRAVERARRFYLEELNHAGTSGDVALFVDASAEAADSASTVALGTDDFERLLVGNLGRADAVMLRCFDTAYGVHVDGAGLPQLSDEEVDEICRSLPETSSVGDAQLESEVVRAAARASRSRARAVTKTSVTADKS
jgi:RNA polymerase sigma factor (sigma-70 family)